MGGYELRKELSTEFGIMVSFGTLYPHLRNLERSKFISQDANGAHRKRKKVYGLTPLGANTLRFNALAIIKIANTLRPVLDSD